MNTGSYKKALCYRIHKCTGSFINVRVWNLKIDFEKKQFLYYKMCYQLDLKFQFCLTINKFNILDIL